MNRWLSLALILLLAAQVLGAEQRGATNPPGDEEQAVSDFEPYTGDEFPDWLHVVRRAEIILIGAFPITTLFSSLAYDGFRTLRTAAEQGSVAGSANSEFGVFTDAESRGILIAGVSLAAIVSLIDFLIVSKDKNSDR